MSLKNFVSSNPEQAFEYASLVATILEGITQAQFGNGNILYVQDIGVKPKDHLFIDKSSNELVKALKDTEATSVTEEDFTKYSLPVIGGATGGSGSGEPGPAGPKGDKGDQGFQGPAGATGTNGLTTKIVKEGTKLKTQLSGERALMGYYYPAGTRVPSVVESYPFTTLRRIFINNMPKEIKNVRLHTVTFNMTGEQGQTVGSMNPAFGRPAGTFPELGTLDPSNGTKYPVRGGVCNIEPTVDMAGACKKQMDGFNKVMKEKAVRVGYVEYFFELLDEGDGVIGNTNIREYYVDEKVVSGDKVDLLGLDELETKKVKNLKDGSAYEMWIGTKEEFEALGGEEALSERVLYQVIDTSTGIITTRVKKK